MRKPPKREEADEAATRRVASRSVRKPPQREEEGGSEGLTLDRDLREPSSRFRLLLSLFLFIFFHFK